MITTKVKKQLIIFAAMAGTAALIIFFGYAKIPTALGFGQMKLTALFADGAGVYPNSNVTTRGVHIGEVKEVSLTPEGVQVVMSVTDDAQIGADARAEIHSVAAIGEQYVEVFSDQPAGPYLQPDSVIPLSRTSVPAQIAPVLDKLTALLASIPNPGLQTLLDEGYKAFQNLGPDLRTLVDSSQSLIDAADQAYVPTKTLIHTVGPLLDTQNIAATDVRSLFRDLAGFTDVLREEDGRLRSALPAVRDTAARAEDFLDDNENATPILAHNLERVGQVAGVYRNGLEQVLIQYPIVFAREQITVRGPNRGLRAKAVAGVYAGCTTGFQSQELRNPQDFTDRDAIAGAYCKVPHDDHRLVRGARNVPCSEGRVGMRAATIDECLGRTPGEVTGSSSGLNTRIGETTGTLPQKGPFSPPDNQVGYRTGASDSDPLAQMGGVGTPVSGEEQTWQSLLTAPLER